MQLVCVMFPYESTETSLPVSEQVMAELHSHEEITDKFCFVSPVQNYGYMFRDFEHPAGIRLCTRLASFCDMILLYGNWTESRACREINKFAHETSPRIPIIEMQDISLLRTAEGYSDFVRQLNYTSNLA